MCKVTKNKTCYCCMKKKLAENITEGPLLNILKILRVECFKKC